MLKNKIKVLIFYALLWVAQSSHCSFNVTSFLAQNTTGQNVLVATAFGAASGASGAFLTSSYICMDNFQYEKEKHEELSLARQERINTIEARLFPILRHRSDHETVIHFYTRAPLPIVKRIIGLYLFDQTEEQKATAALARLKKNKEDHDSQKPSLISHVVKSLPKIGRDTFKGGVGGGLTSGYLAISFTSPNRR